MGPNGSGKSTLANTLLGHPKYRVTQGHVYFKGQDVLPLPPDERAKLGLFLAFQYPTEVPGVRLQQFMRLALKAQGREVPALEFRKQMREQMKTLRVPVAFANRYVNDGLSGGEKKRSEVL